MSSELNPEECDATGDAQGGAAGLKIFLKTFASMGFAPIFAAPISSFDIPIISGTKVWET